MRRVLTECSGKGHVNPCSRDAIIKKRHINWVVLFECFLFS